MTTHDIYINAIHVLPSTGKQQNVVAKVHWEMIFVDGDLLSKSGGETMLNTANLSSFTPVEQLTEAQVAGWIKDDLIANNQYDEIVRFHTDSIARARLSQSLSAWTSPLAGAKPRPVQNTVTLQV